jgi:hypothetical protein
MKKQISIFELSNDKNLKRRFSRTAHGGGLNTGKRKLDRPLSTKRPIHITLRSTQARGAWSFLGFKNRIYVENIIKKQARKFGVVIQDFANVGNHLHIKSRAGSREGFQSFLRSVTCMIARKITRARRGHKLKNKFWDDLAFTRVLSSYREELNLRGYFTANRIEADRGPAARAKVLAGFREWMRTTYGPPVVNTT